MTIDIAEPFARRERDAPPRQNPTSHSGPNKFHTAQGRLWVNRVGLTVSESLPLCPQTRTLLDVFGMSQRCQGTKSLRDSPLRG